MPKTVQRKKKNMNVPMEESPGLIMAKRLASANNMNEYASQMPIVSLQAIKLTPLTSSMHAVERDAHLYKAANLLYREKSASHYESKSPGMFYTG